MGQRKGHPPCKGAGRPRGAKDKEPRQLKVTPSEELRQTLLEALNDNKPELIAKAMKELKSLEGYAYLSGLTLMFKQVMPMLQSIEFNATVKNEKSILISHIESLKIN